MMPTVVGTRMERDARRKSLLHVHVQREARSTEDFLRVPSTENLLGVEGSDTLSPKAHFFSDTVSRTILLLETPLE